MKIPENWSQMSDKEKVRWIDDHEDEIEEN